MMVITFSLLGNQGNRYWFIKSIYLLNKYFKFFSFLELYTLVSERKNKFNNFFKLLSEGPILFGI